MFGSMLLRNNSHSYSEIVNSDGEVSNRSKFWDAKGFFTTCTFMKLVMLGMTLLLVGIIIVQGVEEHNTQKDFENELLNNSGNGSDPYDGASYFPFIWQTNKEHPIPMPAGVNIGSWLSLEDYFFAGVANAVEVATPGHLEEGKKIASCLPPLHVGSRTGPKWQSETDLFRNLMDPSVTRGGSVKHAIEVFAAHRASFVDLDTDLRKLAALGVTSIRVPMSWCWTEKDPRKVKLASYDSDEDLLRDFACEDPFFTGNNATETDANAPHEPEQIYWPAIPKPLIEDLLRSCARAGIRASLDVHTLPGGTSIGTFSGVWPHWPRFWTHGGDGVPIEGSSVTEASPGFGIGHDIFRELVAWMEDLSETDPLAFEGLRGLSPMNEPAHLAGMFETWDPNNFLPELPKDTEDAYVQELSSGMNGADVVRGKHLRVFYWFKGAIQIFRESKLPALGKELQANIHESVMPRMVPWEDTDEDDEQQKGLAMAGWWCAQGSTTEAHERSDWAVLDVHHYHAWGSSCSGTIDGQDAAYACGDDAQRREVLKACATWVDAYRAVVDAVCGVDGKKQASKLMSGEFSAASHHEVRRSCTDVAGLRESYVRQVRQAQKANVDVFYWSYKMPYGGAFKSAGWSFSELLYQIGVLDRPDTPKFDCDAHSPEDPDVP